MFMPWFQRFEDYCHLVFRDAAASVELSDWMSIQKLQESACDNAQLWILFFPTKADSMYQTKHEFLWLPEDEIENFDDLPKLNDLVDFGGIQYVMCWPGFLQNLDNEHYANAFTSLAHNAVKCPLW